MIEGENWRRQKSTIISRCLVSAIVQVKVLLTEIEKTLRKVTISVLNINFKVFMRHPDAAIKKTVGSVGFSDMVCFSSHENGRIT